MSVSSTNTCWEKASHSVWKYSIPPSVVSVVVLSPGSTTAGARRGENMDQWERLILREGGAYGR